MVSYYQGMDCYGCNYLGGDMCCVCAEYNPDGRKEVVRQIKVREMEEATKK